MSPEPKIAVWAALGLHAIRPEDPSAAKVLVEYRNESIPLGPRYRAYAEESLPDPWEALDEVLATLARDHRHLLETSLRSPDDYLAVRAARALLRSDPTHAAAQETLIAHRGSTDTLAIAVTMRALTCIEPAADWARGKFEDFLEKHEQRDQSLKPLAWLARANAVRGSLAGLEERWRQDEKLDYLELPLLACVAFHPAHVPELERLLGPRSGLMAQWWAVEVLSRMTASADSAARALLGALKARPTYLRQLALAGLARLRPRGLGVTEALLPLIERNQDAIRAFRVLETLGDEAVPHLVKLLAHSDPEIRTLAAWTLGKIGPDARSSVEALAKALREDSDLVTRTSAAEALGRIGPPALAARTVAPPTQL